MSRFIYSKSWLRNNIEATVYVPVPEIWDKSKPSAMGDSPLERDENIMKFAEEVVFPEYFRAIKKIIARYEQSKMPIRYIIGQEIDIFPMIDCSGIYSIISGKIAVDNDGVFDIRCEGSGTQIFGHEIGHKVVCVKKSMSKELLENVKEYFSVSEELAHEIIAELSGEIVANDGTSMISYLDENVKNYFKQKILKLACN